MTAKAKSGTSVKQQVTPKSGLKQPSPKRDLEQQTAETQFEPTASQTEVEPAAVSESDLQQTAAEYDQAIQEYADYYQRQQGFYDATGYGWANPVSFAQGSASPWGQETAASSDEEDLYLLEQAVTDFQEALPYIKSLKGREKTEYLASWKEHLTGIARLGAELIGRLERELRKEQGGESA